MAQNNCFQRVPALLCSTDTEWRAYLLLRPCWSASDPLISHQSWFSPHQPAVWQHWIVPELFGQCKTVTGNRNGHTHHFILFAFFGDKMEQLASVIQEISLIIKNHLSSNIFISNVRILSFIL